MQESYITNNHLRITFNEVGDYLERGQKVPESLFLEFMAELRVSNLLIPGVMYNDDLVFEHLIYDTNSTVIPLYTDDEEYIKHKGLNSEYNPIPNNIDFYIDLINANNYDGIIINLASESFFIPSDLLNNMPCSPIFSVDDNFMGYGPNQLKDIAESTSNDSLINFIRNPSNKNDFDGLIMELTKSTLFNVVRDIDNLEKYSKNGIISREDVGRFELCTAHEDNKEFGMLFTSKNAILNSIDSNSEFYYFYQITVLSEFFDFVLRRDMNGVIINPHLDDFFISRRVLLAFSDIMDNPNFNNGPDYAFLLK